MSERIRRCAVLGVLLLAWGAGCGGAGESRSSVELCNGVDDDGDGAIDEELGELSCGKGACARTVPACLNGEPHTCTPGESSEEKCNGKDDDCDGAIDEEIQVPTCGKGACERPGDACVDGKATHCTPGEPSEEVCNGKDDDCDGEIDEGDLSCGVGACARTVPACLNGKPNDTCAPGTPSAEVCNGQDDDCDGEIDEGLGELSCGVGACARTVPACLNGKPNTCVPGQPKEEKCNGKDDDCDGKIDEELVAVTCGLGACERPGDACVNGKATNCTPGAPAAETCNGVDDDCDGEIDNGLGELSCGVGACARTVPACLNGKPNVCAPGSPTAEVCNGVDDDCDGKTDEDLGTQSCGVGACQRSAPACDICVPGQPAQEVCNGVDDDCDGEIDENVTSISLSAHVGGEPVSEPVEVWQGVVVNADGTGCDGQARPLGQGLDWYVSDTAVAEMDSGILTANGPGQVKVHAEMDGVSSNTLDITYKLPATVALVAMDLSPHTAILDIGESVQLEVRGAYTDLSESDLSGVVSWSSSDPAVVTTGNAGLITAKGYGSAVVSAEHDGIPLARKTIIAVVPKQDASLYASALLGPGGGSLSLGDLSIDFPAGALASPRQVQVARASMPQELNPESSLIGPSYVVHAGDGRFANPVQVTLRYDPAGIPQGVSAQDLRMVRHDGRGWSFLGSAVQNWPPRVTASVHGFSVIGLDTLKTFTDAELGSGYTIKKVPYYQQPKGTNWCALTSTAMVMKYYGVQAKAWQIAGKMKVPRKLAEMPDAILPRYGFSVRNQPWENYDEGEASWKELIKTIKERIREDRPIIFAPYGYVLAEGEKLLKVAQGEGHAVVLYGYTNEKVYIHDPNGAFARQGREGSLEWGVLLSLVGWNSGAKTAGFTYKFRRGVMFWATSGSPSTKGGSLELAMRSATDKPWTITNSQVIPSKIEGTFSGKDSLDHPLGYYYSGSSDLPGSSYQGIVKKVLSPLTELRVPFQSYGLVTSARVTFNLRDPSTKIVKQEEKSAASGTFVYTDLCLQDKGVYSIDLTLFDMIGNEVNDSVSLALEVEPDKRVTSVKGVMRCATDAGAKLGVSGVDVQILTKDRDGNAIAKQTTGGDGSYSFDQIDFGCAPQNLELTSVLGGSKASWNSGPIVPGGTTMGSSHAGGGWLRETLTTGIGQVVDQNNAPVDGATVTIDGVAGKTATTANGGLFEFKDLNFCGVTQIVATAEKDGSKATSSGKAPVVNGTTDLGVTTLAAGTTIVQGKVTVNGKSPGAKVGLKVTLANDPGFTLSPEPQTETDGTFSIGEVPANKGNITVTATYQGQSKTSGSIPPKPGDVTDVGTIDFSCPDTAWGSNSPTILPGKSLTISVTGGQAPYVWTAEIEGANGGKGFTLAGTTSAPTNVLVAAANACGSVKITVRGCNGIGEPTTGYVRAEPAGVWVEKSKTCGLPGTPDASTWNGAMNYVKTVGNKRQYQTLAHITAPGDTCGDGVCAGVNSSSASFCNAGGYQSEGPCLCTGSAPTPPYNANPCSCYYCSCCYGPLPVYNDCASFRTSYLSYQEFQCPP